MRLFQGGIHPSNRKESTKNKPLLPLTIQPSYIALPMLDDSGDLYHPLVELGDPILWGQKVAEPATADGVPLYSGISGVVKAITQHPHPILGMTLSLIIENDHKNTKEAHPNYPYPQELTQEQVITILRVRGLRGMARNSSAVCNKVMEGRGKIDTLIINACECEPYLSGDHRILLEGQELIIAGSKLLAYAMGAKQIVVALQGDKLDAMEELEQHKTWDSSFMRIRTLPSRYPLGEEHQVVRFVTRKELRPNQPSYLAHCGVFNVSTAHAVGDCFLKGKVQTHRAVTVAGGGLQRARNFWVPIGTPFDCVLDNVEGLREDVVTVLSGGPMSGVPQKDLSVPVLVNTQGILALASWEVPKHLQKKTKNHFPCIHCGHCLTVCPQHLRPYLIYQTMTQPKKPKLPTLHPQDCIGCGCCNYRCPAHLPLAQSVQEAKRYVEALEGDRESDVKIYDPKKVKVKTAKHLRKRKIVQRTSSKEHWQRENELKISEMEEVERGKQKNSTPVPHSLEEMNQTQELPFIPTTPEEQASLSHEDDLPSATQDTTKNHTQGGDEA